MNNTTQRSDPGTVRPTCQGFRTLPMPSASSQTYTVELGKNWRQQRANEVVQTFDVHFTRPWCCHRTRDLGSYTFLDRQVSATSLSLSSQLKGAVPAPLALRSKMALGMSCSNSSNSLSSVDDCNQIKTVPDRFLHDVTTTSCNSTTKNTFSVASNFPQWNTIVSLTGQPFSLLLLCPAIHCTPHHSSISTSAAGSHLCPSISALIPICQTGLRRSQARCPLGNVVVGKYSWSRNERTLPLTASVIMSKARTKSGPRASGH